MDQQMVDDLHLVRRFRHLRALVIGDALLDSYVEGEAERLCREGPIPLVYKTMESHVPGGAANVAVNLRALEADVIFLSAIGCDYAGLLLRSVLTERGISDDWIVEDSTLRTPHKLRILADGQYVVRLDDGIRPQKDQMLSSFCQQALLERLEKAYKQCDLVVVSDYCYGVWSALMIEQLHELQMRYPTVLLIDSQALQRFRQVHATVVTPNAIEARRFIELFASAQAANASMEQIAGYLLEYLDAEQVVITLSKEGVFLRDQQNKMHHLPAYPVEHAQDVGAGDSFAAAMALALAAGGRGEQAAQIGIDCSGIAVSKPRTAVVSYQELLQRVSLRLYTTLQGQKGGVSREQLISHLKLERVQGRRIVFTNGVFDVLHAGHVHFFRQANALGDILVVGINNDQSARRIKGPGRPVNTEQDRLALVTALDMVDHALLFEENTAAALIRLLCPEVYVKGGDYEDVMLPEEETNALEDVGCQQVVLPLVGTSRLTQLIDLALAQEASS